MTTTEKFLGFGVLIAIVIAIAAFFHVGGIKAGDISGCTGTTSCFTDVYASGLFQLSSAGTSQANQIVTKCSIISNASASATSSVYGYCTGVTGVTSADTVSANFGTSTTLLQDEWMISGAKASTTAGAIDFSIYNGTGRAQAFSAATTIGSSTVIRAGH